MANTLTNIMPKILARGLMTLRQRVLMPRLVNSDYADDAAKKGDVINVPIPAAQTASDVTPSNTPPTPASNAPSVVAIPLDQWKHSDFNLTDKELGQIDENAHFVPMQMDEALKALANAVNQNIWDKYKEGVAGTAGFAASLGTGSTTSPSDPFSSAVTELVNARKLLNQQLCPLEDRRLVMNFNAEANALALAAFRDASQKGDNRVIAEGSLGRIFGIDTYADDHVPTHTTGTLSDASGSPHKAIVNGALALGAQTMNIDSTTLTGTIVPGDVFLFASHSQPYCVTNTSNVTASGNAATGITFAPALVVAVADNVVLYFAPTHAVNIAFHRNAFAFATRPLAQLTVDKELGHRILSMQDPISKLTLRLEVMRQYKQTVWDFDILWGAKLVRPELATRIAGAP